MTEETMQPPLTLDHNGEIAVTFALTSDGLELTLDYPHLTSKRFARQLIKGIGIEIDGEKIAPRHEDLSVGRSQMHWAIPWKQIKLGEDALTNEGDRVTITLYGQPVLNLMYREGRVVMDPSRTHERLTVSEIKTLANTDTHIPNVPYPRDSMRGFHAEHHAPITELHTHSTAQIKAEDLMRIAVNKDRAMDEPGITYPHELLQLLGVTLSPMQENQLLVVPSINFDPTSDDDDQPQCEKPARYKDEQGIERTNTCKAIRLKDLTREQRDVVVRKMKIAQDNIQPFSRFDPEMYRYRNPLAKRGELTFDMIMQIARDYQANGIQYAELSTGSMLENPKWFSEMIRAVKQAETETGVTVRFLASIPRSFEPEKMLKALERVKHAARHPYVVGVDMLGYEFNSTKDFAWALEHIAQWASVPEGTDLTKEQGWDFRRDFTIRVHAGETSKRPENVIECAKIAATDRYGYGVKVRIAHALNAKMSPMNRKLIKEQADAGRLIIELCPPSNLAYNNISAIDMVPVKEWSAIAPVTLSTDGGGAVQSNATQLALDALAAGWTINDLAKMRENEAAYINDQRAFNAAKSAAFEARYGQNPDAAFMHHFMTRLKDIAEHTIDKEFDGRLPYLIVGAGGQTYNELIPENMPERHEIAIAMEMLVLATDPSDHAYMLGRVKQEGVSGEADKSLIAHRTKYPAAAFPTAGIYGKGTTEMAKSLTYCEAIPAEPSAIPFNLYKRATSLHPPAFAIFISGSNFTNDVMRYYHNDDAYSGGRPFVVMENAEGASKDFAKYVDPSKRFKDGPGFLRAIDVQIRHSDAGQAIYGEQLPFKRELYRAGPNGELTLDNQKIEALYEEAKKVVTHRKRNEIMVREAQRQLG